MIPCLLVASCLLTHLIFRILVGKYSCFLFIYQKRETEVPCRKGGRTEIATFICLSSVLPAIFTNSQTTGMIQHLHFAYEKREVIRPMPEHYKLVMDLGTLNPFLVLFTFIPKLAIDLLVEDQF